jgi:hypothetical protein
MFAPHQKADLSQVNREGCFGPILLQKSFCSTEHKFSGPWVRLSKNYVGDYFIVR